MLKSRPNEMKQGGILDDFVDSAADHATILSSKFHTILCCLFALLAILLLVYFKFAQASVMIPILATVAVFFLVVTSRLKRSSSLLVATVLALLVYLCFFLHNLVTSQMLRAPRLLVVGIILFTAAVSVSTVLSFLNPELRKKFLIGAGAVAAILFFWEAILGFLTPQPAPVRWYGGLKADALLGLVPVPHSEMRTVYARNPRNYFSPSDPRENLWWLHTCDACFAEMILNNENGAKIEIEKTLGQAPYDVQLNVPQFRVQMHHRYVILFKARSASPRTMHVGFSRAQHPWGGLGLYSSIALTAGWQTFQLPFEATANENDGRIHFDVGSTKVEVEVKGVSLHDVEGRTILPTAPPPAYEIRYRFNDHGCRGPDVPTAKTSQTRRILILGSANTFGIGVREEDTFPFQLAGLLRAADKVDEVINCAVPGYSVLENRLAYETRLKDYRPNAVVLVLPRMIEDVNSSNGQLQHGLFEQLFFTWSTVPDYPTRTPSPDRMLSLDEILRLKNELSANNVQLLLVLLRTDADHEGRSVRGKLWNSLTIPLSGFARENSIPFLDTGRLFSAIHSYSEDLAVSAPEDLHLNNSGHMVLVPGIARFLKAELKP